MARVAARDGASDEQLMRQVQDREDVEAFGYLYDRHAARAYRLARSVCGDRFRSEQAVQEGFLSIWRGRARFRPASGSFQAWSMRIVRHAAIDVLRHDAAEKRPRLVEQAVEPVDSRVRSPEEQVLARSEAEAVHAALARLPEAQAEVITLGFFGELTHTEIAQQLNLPPGTVKGRMRLGLEKLRSQIDR
jgi:RNA polymerase sigma-70 factor (ECF subfamily)